MSASALRTRYYTPPQLAELWVVTPETVIGEIKAGRLKAFTISPPRCKRPRWRINPAAVQEYEDLHGPQMASKRTPTRRNKVDADYIEYV